MLNLAMHGELFCHTCFTFKRPPYYMCPNSHYKCQECHPPSKPNVCKECSEKIMDDRIIIMEKLFDNYIFRCRYQNYGCPAKKPGKLLKEHEERCPLRRAAQCGNADDKGTSGKKKESRQTPRKKN
ncbi:E3 ubiquitin-protein ligase Siah1-like [Coccinella septempunctata]|uniref:E3 ubiquitin-protein ligase Siah1-like n=1 Tax=Coccinella septempunctata TaxID=41139 RepID=UPI001D0811A6|nr:E3 ubiquitin-protein ligase Siah1-like [Coccinella septempunctata]